MVTLQKIDIIKNALVENPDLSAIELAGIAGITRQYVYDLCRKHGVLLRDARHTAEAKEWANHFGGNKRLTSHFIGGASELFAAADLLRRGIPVYRALTFLSAADMIADIGGRLIRIEVNRRGGTRTDLSAIRRHTIMRAMMYWLLLSQTDLLPTSLAYSTTELRGVSPAAMSSADLR